VSSTHPTLRALACPGVKALALARALRAAGATIFATALFWHVYRVSDSELAIGLIGGVEFVPVLLIGPFAGALADATDRIRLTMLAEVGYALTCGVLALQPDYDVATLLVAAAVAASCAAVEFPALATVLPNLVPRAIFPSAVSLIATLRNLGWASGPLVAGFALDALGVERTYGLAAVLVGASALAVSRIPRAAAPPSGRAVSLAAFREGLAFVRAEKPVLGAMALDLFAVLFAGATALLPVFAEEILRVGPEGYGLLRAALPAGTLAMATLLVLLPPIARAGRALCIAVAVFGVATIAFGFSRSFWLSFAALVVAGMADEVSMVARNVIIQLGTPDALRGRVAAVNQIFVGASNELGAAESGFLAHATSATFAVVFGGFACLGVLATVMRAIPRLARFRVTGALALALLGAALPPAEPASAETRASAGGTARAAPPASAASLFAPHRDEDGYFVPWAGDDARGFGAFLRWQFSRNAYAGMARSAAPRVANDGASLARSLPPGAAELTWVGHATFAVHDPGGVFLTDPHFGPRALLPGRLVAPGVPVAAVPRGAFAVVSHNHYDHLDAYTVGALPAELAWYVPLGLADWFRARGRANVVELDWWESARRGAFTITCLPSQHWSKRIEQGTNESLWCAWLIESAERRYFFAGDTGYFHGFAEFGRRFGPIDAALLPIGAYEPRWFMDFQHLDPAQALQAFRDLRARTLFAMHWGTFELTDEPPDEAPRELLRQLPRVGVRPEEVALLAIGETRALPAPLRESEREGGAEGAE
jgi:N-acyl-phosphatidylethanolamine-hydrolysing phospholipase D